MVGKVARMMSPLGAGGGGGGRDELLCLKKLS
jgi:hypothetical protein